jgi:putative redox protein
MSETWKEVWVDWQEGMSFSGHNQAGGTVQIGTTGQQPGTGPMELLLLGVAGCTGMDIVSILTKKRQPPSAFQVRVRGKRAEEHPKIYTEIEVTYLLWGTGIDPKAVEQAIQLSEDKYCSASAMLSKAAKISSSYRILDPEETFSEISS